MVYKNKNKLLIFLIIISLSLMKNVGIVLSLIILFQVFVKAIIDKPRNLIKTFKFIFLTILVLAITYVTWSLKCSNNDKHIDERHDKNTVETIDVGVFISTIFGNPPDERCEIVLKKYIEYLKNGDFVADIPYTNIIMLVVIFNIILILSIFKSDKRINEIALLIALDIGFLLYNAAILATFMFVFTYYEASVVMGMYRYLSTYIIAIGIISIFSFIENCKKRDMIVPVLLLIFVIINIDFKYIYTQQIQYLEWDNNKYKPTVSRLLELYNIPDDAKIFLLFQSIEEGQTAVTYHVIRYKIAPISTNLLYEWKIISEEENQQGYCGVTKNEFVKLLLEEDFEYVYILEPNWYLYEQLKDMMEVNFSDFEDFQIMNYLYERLFKVEIMDGEEINLVPFTLDDRKL